MRTKTVGTRFHPTDIQRMRALGRPSTVVRAATLAYLDRYTETVPRTPHEESAYIASVIGQRGSSGGAPAGDRHAVAPDELPIPARKVTRNVRTSR